MSRELNNMKMKILYRGIAGAALEHAQRGWRLVGGADRDTAGLQKQTLLTWWTLEKKGDRFRII